MNYLVFLSFELERASDRDFDNAFSDLYTLGLKRLVTAEKGDKVVLPGSAAMGMVDGESAAVVQASIRARAQELFKARHFNSKIFVVVGGDWAWGATSTYAPRLALGYG